MYLRSIHTAKQHPVHDEDKTRISVKMQYKACDECYNRKKRCVKRGASSICLRCADASLECTLSRPQLRPGRPPKKDIPGIAKESLGIWDYGILPRSLDQERPSSTRQSPTFAFPSSNLRFEDFYLLNDIYMFGPSFADDFRQALQYCHRHSPELLGEIFLALGSCLSWARLGTLTADQVDVRSGAISIEKLRKVVIRHLHDAIAVLMLGQALAAFDSLVNAAGTISILRCSLSLVRPWYPEIAQNQLLETVAIAPIFWDTIWCLLHREVPLIQPLFSRTGVIDRVAGLCTTLLPILYDLCVINQQLAKGLGQGEALEDIENQIRIWSPEKDPALSLQAYSELEVLSMRTQATMYRIASLLLIHWLRQPLKSDDTTATALANDILEARTRFFAAAGTGAILQNVSFPLFLALLEIPLSPEDLWESSTWLRIRPVCVDRLYAFTHYFWEQRRSGFEGSLFDVIHNGPEFVPVP